MHSWKDKVTDKLVHLFSDSPAASSPSPAPSSLRQPTQARPQSKDGNYLSSVLPFILPSNDSSSNKQENVLKPIQSNPTRWNTRSISWKEPLDTFEECDDEFDPREENGEQRYLKTIECENRQNSYAGEEHGDQGSGRSNSSSEFFEDATDIHTIEKSIPDLPIESLFISSELYQFFQSSLPNIVKGCQWFLLYRAVRQNMAYHFERLFGRVVIFLVLVY